MGEPSDSPEVNEIEIRVFAPEDRPALRQLFGRAGEGSPTSSIWGHVPSEAAVYLDPYIDFAPESLFVATVKGKLVGYLTGCLDGTDFPSEKSRMERAIREHRLITKAGPAAFFARSLLDTALSTIQRTPTSGELDDARWPAHAHINLVASARGTGAAGALMRSWFDRLTESGTRGCYVQTVVENTRAVRFFRRMGFTEHGPTPTVPGLRYNGRRVHQQTMVRSV